MNGKSKCKVLKNIRKKIAEDNDIAFVTSECKFQGECSGTCPKCEAELRYLEKELAKRINLGKAVAVAGIATALVVSSAGCTVSSPDQTAGEPLSQPPTYQTQPSTTEPTTTVPDPGDVLLGETSESFDDELLGETLDPDDILMGDIALPEDPT